MNKFVVLLIISTILMSGVSGLLFYQLNVIENENRKLKDELFVVNAQLPEISAQLEEQQTHGLQLESQIIELEEQLRDATNKVKITVFTSNMTDFPPKAGCFWYSDYVVTVLNFGINDVNNLRIDFEGQYYGYYPDEPYYNEVYHNWSLNIGTVKVGESKTVHQWHQMPMDKPTVAWLMMGDMILDTRNFNQ